MSTAQIFDEPGQRIEAGVDWITFIADTRRAGDHLASVVVPLGVQERAAGHAVKPFRFVGFEGQRCGAVRLGFRKHQTVAQLSGELCASSWTQLQACSGRVTRLDLQTTISFASPRTQFADSLLQFSRAALSKRPGTPPATTYSSDTGGLCIGTVGRRTNGSYARVYDKGVEQRTHLPGHRWRIELEAKQEIGAKLWESMKQERDVPAWCYGVLASQWRSWGLHWRLPKPSVTPVLPSADRKAPAPAHALAAWLLSSVQPVVPRVLAMYSVTEVLTMLGMDHLATANDAIS